MPDAYILALEVDDNGTIKIQNFKKNVEGAGAATEKAGKQTEAGRMGFFLLGEAIEETGRTAGISGQVMRRVGNTVEDVAARSFPRWGAALGIAGIAGTALVGVVATLIDRKQKLREETLKAASAAEEWVLKARISTKETGALRDANERLWESEKKRAEFSLKQGISAEEEKIADLSGKVQRIKRWIEIDPDAVSVYGMMIAGTKKSRIKNLQDAELEMESAIAGLQKKYALQDIAGGKGGGVKRKVEGEKPGKTPGDIYAEQLQAEADYARASVGLATARGDDLTQIQQLEIDAFDAAAQAKAATLKDEDDLKAYWALVDMDRQTLALNQERQTADAKKKISDKDLADFQRNEQFKRQAMVQTAGNFAQMGMLMSSLGGQHARKWFTLQKTASIAESMINTYQGATKAYAQGGIWGVALAASIIALGMAQVAKIRSMEFDGGGGGDAGGGAVPTYNANPGTGLPASSGSQERPLNITIKVNEETRSVVQITKDVVQTLFEQNGSIGGLSIAVERSI